MRLSSQLVLGFSLSYSYAAGPIVDLGYAQYQGVSNVTTGLNTFLGVRYAAAPTGGVFNVSDLIFPSTVGSR